MDAVLITAGQVGWPGLAVDVFVYAPGSTDLAIARDLASRQPERLFNQIRVQADGNGMRYFAVLLTRHNRTAGQQLPSVAIVVTVFEQPGQASAFDWLWEQSWT